MRIAYAAAIALVLAGCGPNKGSAPPGGRSTVPPPPEVTVRAAAFSSNNQRLLIGFSAQNPLLKLWDVTTGKELWTTVAHQGSVTSVAFLEDGKRAYSSGADGDFKLWNFEAQREIRSIASGEKRINQLVVLPDEKFLMTSHPAGRIKIWDTSSYHVVRTLDGGPERVSALAVSPDGKRALSAHNGEATYTKIWEIQKGVATRIVTGLGWGYDACFSPDSRFALSAKRNGIAAHLVLWNVADGSEIRVFKGNLHEVLFLAFSPDAKQIFSGGFDHILRCWDSETGKVLWKTQLREATAFALSPDGKQLFTASGNNDYFPIGRRLEIWDTATGTRTRTLEGSPVNPVFRERGPSQ